MTSQILIAELTTLVQDSKRKNPELRNAAEKSLQEVKTISVTSEPQLAADLVRKPHFISPFLLACSSKNAKFASSGAGCLQRLAIAGALPKERLKEVIEALKDGSSFGLDVQLKILQTLSALTQNYSSDIRGDLLFGLLQVCSALQASKQSSVSNSAAATLQQLIIALFESLEAEDRKAHEVPTIATVSCGEQQVNVRPVAYDAFRTFNDICLLTEGEKPRYLKTASLPQTSGLELIESVLSGHALVFDHHPEQAHTLRTVLMPFMIRSLSERQSFPTTVRIMRILAAIVRRHLKLVPSECETALNLLNHMLDPDAAAPWKRALCLELFRFIYNDVGILLQLCSTTERDGQKRVLRDNLAIFVRLASEKPSLIGLGQQSTLPSGQPSEDGFNDPVSLDTNVVTGLIGSSGGSSAGASGISTYWSSVKTPLLDQLDKSDAPALPETYIYSLVLTCINNLSDTLAKFILPLTVQRELKGRKRADTLESSEQEDAILPSNGDGNLHRSASDLSKTGAHRRRTVPLNPLTLEGHKSFDGIKAIAAIVDHSWPAVLASCSTFLYAALDNEYYRALIRSFQKFTQVAGLLQMATPRDAFLTTLGKAAVPANIIAASMSPTTPGPESPGLFTSSGGLLSVDSLVSGGASNDSSRASTELGPPTLNARNLLCLRALLNIAIALGPTLENAWDIVCETLQQAEMIMATSGSKGLGRDQRPNTKSLQRSESEEASSQSVANEVNAVQAAALRMFESSSDFPNDAFVHLLGSLCKLLQLKGPPKGHEPRMPLSPNPMQHQRRIGSFSGVSINTDSQIRDYVLALRKIGDVATLNIDRFTHAGPDTSGWRLLTSQLTAISCNGGIANAARRLGAEILSHVVQDPIRLASSDSPELQSVVQRRCLASLAAAIQGLGDAASKQSRDFDSEIHFIWLEALRAIIESSGDAITSGWDDVFELILTAFRPHQLPSVVIERTRKSRAEVLVDAKLDFKHVKLGRSAFDSAQLICSDFLRIIPERLFSTLVNTLFRFCAQTDDLNISLTMTGIFWNISDFLQTRTQDSNLTSELESLTSLNKPPHVGELESPAAVWLCLLQRLVMITADQRVEVRNTAIHTLYRIFGNSELSADAWSICVETVLLRMLNSNVKRHEQVIEGDTKSREAWTNSSRLILDGFSDLLAVNLNPLMQTEQWSSLWEMTAESFRSYLDLQSLVLHGLIYSNLVKLLNQIPQTRTDFESEDLVLNLWLNYSPSHATSDLSSNPASSYEAYVQCFQEIYKLFHFRMLYVALPPLPLNASVPSGPGLSLATSHFKKLLDVPHVSEGQGVDTADDQTSKLERCVDNLLVCVAKSVVAAYDNDIDQMTVLQSSVLRCLEDVHIKCRKAQPLLVTSLARLIALPYLVDNAPEHGKRSTFVALAKAAMRLLSKIISDSAREKDDLTLDALALALMSLARPIELKYQWRFHGKAEPLWRLATTTALTTLESCLPPITVSDNREHQDYVQQIWLLVVSVAHAIASADCSDLESTVSIDDDEAFDIRSHAYLHDLIIPALGSTEITDTARRLYISSLFLTSLTNSLEPDDYPRPPSEPLEKLYDVRFGRTFHSEPAIRTGMAYHCLTKLLSLTSNHEGEANKVERIALARVAAPYLILRAALPIKAYTADQPLRGRMPQPFGEREELLFVVRNMTELNSEPKAIPEAEGAKTEHKRHLVRLYPILVKALQVAGRCQGLAKDNELIEQMTLWLDIMGGDFGI